MSALTRVAGYLTVFILFLNLREIVDMIRASERGDKTYERSEVVRSIVILVGTSLLCAFLFYLCCISDKPDGNG